MTHPLWKPTAADLRAIRDYAALAARKRPQAISMDIGERVDYDTSQTSTNLLFLNGGAVDDIFSGTDLHDFVSWADFKRFGVELTRSRRAVVDIYVYERGFGGDHGELLTNIQVYVAPDADGKPVLAGFSGTMMDYQPVI